MYNLGLVQDGQVTTRLPGGSDMGRMLNLLDSLLAKDRSQHDLGRSSDALPILRSPAARPELPEPLAADVRRLLGDVYLSLREYRQARKQFAALLRLQPDDAAAHHQLASAFQADPEVDARRATK